MKEAAVSVKDVFYRFEGSEANAVDGITLDIPKGEFIAVLGRNGSGKSTLGKLINGLYVPTSGSVTVCGKTFSNEEQALEIRKSCGMVFQDPDNQIVATIVEEDVAFGCENLGIPSEEIVRRVSSALETVSMTKYANTAPHMLSGGQKQRVAIAGVIAMQPEVIIFDESTSMLDPAGRHDIFTLAKRLNASGTTVIWITHFMEEAVQADRVVVISGGKLVLDGTPREVFSDTGKIESLGLDAPDMTKLAAKLRAGGINVRADILTLEEMEVELCRLNSAM